MVRCQSPRSIPEDEEGGGGGGDGGWEEEEDMLLLEDNLCIQSSWGEASRDAGTEDFWLSAGFVNC